MSCKCILKKSRPQWLEVPTEHVQPPDLGGQIPRASGPSGRRLWKVQDTRIDYFLVDMKPPNYKAFPAVMLYI